jgi:hypothetical protein
MCTDNLICTEPILIRLRSENSEEFEEVFCMPREYYDCKQGDQQSIMFEKLTTKLLCYRCNQNTLVHNTSYTPFQDVFCKSCNYTYEVKSVRQLGKQKNGIESGYLKLGAESTYKNISSRTNTGLLIYYYLPITRCNDYDCNYSGSLLRLDIHSIIFIPLDHVFQNKDYSLSTCFQKKLVKVLFHFEKPIFEKITRLNKSDFSGEYSYNCDRQILTNQAIEFIKLCNAIKKYNKKRKRYILNI